MPRMPVDYKAFFSRLGGNPLRLWQLFAVGLSWGRYRAGCRFKTIPTLKAFFDIVYAFNVVPSGLDGFQAVPATSAQPGQHCILRFKAEAPRFSLFAGWEVGPTTRSCRNWHPRITRCFPRRLSHPIRRRTCPSRRGRAYAERLWSSYRPVSVAVQVSVDQPALLRVSEEYHVDGRP